MKKIIFLVEDDQDIVFAVKEYLQGKNFIVYAVKTLIEAKQYLENQLPSLIIIDWNLPDGNGDQLCQWLRKKSQNLPIVFLTVRGDTKDMLKGFDIGADDYIVKPFNLEILYSRVCAILRRTGNVEENILLCGSISIDKNRIQVFCNNEEVLLSSTEYELLLLLMENKNYTLPRKRLLEIIWDKSGNFVNDNTLTVTMKRLREKLHNPSCLKTIRSIGYRMEDEK
jgi:DNA-binding response OmpR family regulator